MFFVFKIRIMLATPNTIYLKNIYIIFFYLNGSTHLATKYDPRRSRKFDDGMATNERMQNESSIRTNNIAKKRKQWYAHIVHPMPFLVVPLYDTMSAGMNQSSARLSDRTKTSLRPADIGTVHSKRTSR